MRPYGAPGGDPGAAPPAPGMRPHAQPWSGPEPPFADQFSALSLASSWRPGGGGAAAARAGGGRLARAAGGARAAAALGLLAPSPGGGGGGALSGEEASLAAYVTGLPVAMRPWELAAAFRDCGAAAELLPIKFPGKGTRSGLVVFATPEGIRPPSRGPRSASPARSSSAAASAAEARGGRRDDLRDERQALSRQGVLIFVGSIPTNATDVEVKAAFGVFGNVVRCWSFLTTSGQQDLLCAFVVFADVASANRAVDSHRAGGRVAIGGRFVVIERPSGSEAPGAGRGGAGARHDDRFLPWRLRRAGDLGVPYDAADRVVRAAASTPSLEPQTARGIHPATCCPSRAGHARPVVAACGNSFELEAIAHWLARNETSPVTQEKLASKLLFPNAALRSIIRAGHRP
ncbi:hypothetical protein JL722_750 [Aureococcus anophagefferens]|nr:hypothetical protein JL722_750 [Aureococcus anophagefferens]